VAQGKRVAMVEDQAGDHWESGVTKAIGPHRHTLAERIVGAESIYEKAECLRPL